MWMYTLLPQILNMSLTATIVIILVLLARLLLKKAPKIFSYVLWAVVLFRLVCPVSFTSQFSLMGLFSTPVLTTNGSTYSSINYVPADIVHAESPQVNLPLPGLNDVLNNNLPRGEEQLVADPLEWLMAAATFLWLSGVATMLIYSTSSLIRLRRKLVGAIRLRENIYLADHIASPFVIGLCRPKIYLPSTLREEEQRYVILHEQTHIRRLDHIFKMLAFLALAVHWFNPLVWVAFIYCAKDMEMSCDEHVLKQMGGDIKGAYGASLLSLATGRRFINGSPLAFGEGNIKERIKNIMNFKKTAFWISAAAVAVVIVAGVGLLTNPAPTDTPVASTEETGPFVGYVKDATADTFDVYTDEGGRYITSLPWSLFEQFPASDRTDQNWQPGWMNVDIYYGSIADFTWAVVCTGPSSGTGNANVCTSMDGGKTWWVGDKNAMYTGTVTGASFASSEVGFMSYRYFFDQGPEISRTLDGGKTWARMTVDLPEISEQYKMTPLVPTFKGTSGTYPIEIYDSDGSTSIAYLTTADGGMTWQWRGMGLLVAFVDETLSETEARALQSRIEQKPNVEYADFVTREEAMQRFESKYSDKSLFENLDSSVLRHRYYIYMRDISLTEQTANDMAQIAGIVKVNAGQGV